MYLDELLDEFDPSGDARFRHNLGDGPHHLTVHQFTESKKMLNKHTRFESLTRSLLERLTLLDSYTSNDP